MRLDETLPEVPAHAHRLRGARCSPLAPLRPSSCYPPPASCYPSCCQVEALASGVRNATLAGYLVRARADADTVEARAGFTGRRDAVIAAGPQVGAVSGGQAVQAVQAVCWGYGGQLAGCSCPWVVLRSMVQEHACGTHTPPSKGCRP